MSDDYQAQIEALCDEARSLGHGDTEVALYEEAVRLADAHNDIRLGFNLRKELIESATFSGHPEKSIVAFSWCLAQCDRQPERFREGELLWSYKWIIHRVDNFPQISREQVASMLSDLEKRYRRAGSTMRVVHMLRMDIALGAGDRRAARKHHRLMQQAPRDWLSDCLACEMEGEANYHADMDEHEQAATAMAPLLRGAYRCAEVPHRTYGYALFPLLRLGRVGEAMDCHRKGYRLIAGNRTFLPAVARHLEFLVLTDNLAKAAKLFERHLNWALDSKELNQRFSYYLAAWLLLDRSRANGKQALKFRLTADFPLFQESGQYDIVELAKWFDAQLKEIAGQFDARNGNRYFARRIIENRRKRKLLTPWPLQSAKNAH